MSRNSNNPGPKRKRKARKGEPPVAPHNFVDVISLVIAFLTEYGVRPNGLSLADLEKIKQDESTGKTADEVLEGQYQAAHKTFRLAQGERLKAVKKEVSALRGIYKYDPPVLARLKALRFSRARKGSQEPAKGTENGGEKPGGPAPENPKPEQPK